MIIGCTKYTCEDMWRMVWQENCHRIVMTTNLVERGKVCSPANTPIVVVCVCVCICIHFYDILIIIFSIVNSCEDVYLKT